MQYQAPSASFSEVWRKIADKDEQGFLNLQHKYTKTRYYDIAEQLLAEQNYLLDKHSMAMKECVFSRSVQYGAGNVVELFNESLKK